jgi:hypothetical protein
LPNAVHVYASSLVNGDAGDMANRREFDIPIPVAGFTLTVSFYAAFHLSSDR